jgi:type IV secretory pathway VirB10-like protein
MSAPDDTPDLGAGPQVAAPERPWVIWAGLAGAVALGGVVFATLYASQQQRSADPSALAPPREVLPGRPDAIANEPPPAPELFAAVVAPPAPVVETPPPPPPPPPAAPPPPPYFLPPPPPPAPAGPSPEESARAAAEAANRMKSPAMVVDLTNPAPAAEAGAATAAAAADAFAARLSPPEAQGVRATQIADTATLIPQGVMIAAVLETAINSDLPGFVRAVVSRDVSGFDGSRVLIPRGSRLIGQYRSETAIGQRRAFVVWTRLIRPDGVSITLGSPGTDPQGRAGLEGRVNRHLLERFGPGLLTTALNAALTNSGGSNTQLIIGGTTQVAGALSGEGSQIKPTVSVPQGAAIQVFVARDLDFSGVQPVRGAEPAP